LVYGIHEEHLIPTMEEWKIYPREVTAVGMKVIEQGIARIKLTKDQLYDISSKIIKKAREHTLLLMEKGFIKLP
jgi:malate dehydrogenase (oxaloacetate-decarboxylating)